MRRLALAALCVLVIGLPAAADDLTAAAHSLGLRDPAGFAAIVDSLRNTGHLPARYVEKQVARAHGWHGGGLCTAWPGHAIGGDVFHDFAARLPAAPGRVWHEVDLDESCGSRGPKRLVFSNDGLIYVTTDHYNSFVAVPPP
jgi:hypothetical protein